MKPRGFVIGFGVWLAALASAQGVDAQLAQRLESSWARAGSQMPVVWDRTGAGYALASDTRTWISLADGKTRPWAESDRPEAPRALNSRSGQPVASPDGKKRIVIRNRNVWVESVPPGSSLALTEDGSVPGRIENGTTPWVYDEELSQTEGAGWSTTGEWIWYGRFDSTPVQPFFLLRDQARIQNRLEVLDYPKAGTANPKAELWVIRPDGKGKKRVDAVPTERHEYVWNIRFLDGHRLLYQRMDRRHQNLDVVLFDAESGQSQVLHTERVRDGFIPWQWRPVVAPDAQSIFVQTESAGDGRYRLARIDLKSRARTLQRDPLGDLTSSAILRMTSDAVFVRARAGNLPLADQLVRWDFRRNRTTLLTDPALHHRISVSPDGRHFAALAQLPEKEPKAAIFRVERAGAKLHRALTVSIPSAPEGWPQRPLIERFQFKSACGKFDLTGLLWLPRERAAGERFPLVFDVYLGPENPDVDLDYRPYRALTENGWAVAQVETRGGLGRGTAFRNALYGKLGQVEIDDLAQAARMLTARDEIDPKRVGIYGTSYGGYAALMAILRYPELFSAASASVPPTDWRHYDTIYTERYMGLPQENAQGYDAGNPVPLAPRLKGALQLYYGTSDENVHPNNSLQLIAALDRAGKEYELRLGVDQGHTFVGMNRMIRFFRRAFGQP